MPVEISLEAEIEGYTKYLTKLQREAIPRSTNSALNKTAGNVRTAIARYIAQETGLKVGEVKREAIIIRSNFRTLRALVIGKGRAVTLRRFISPSKRRVGAFRNQDGVVANPWRRRRVHRGTFLIAGKNHGQVIPVKRAGKGRKQLKALYGPSMRVEFGRPAAVELMRSTARARFKINFEHDLGRNLARLEQRQRGRRR